MAKAAPAPKKPPTKTQIMANIAEATGLSKKDVSAVMDALAEEIRKSLSGKGAGIFTVPGLVKIEKKKIPARPARKNVPVRDIRTGEVTIKDLPAKPASNKVKVRALKNLKQMV
jgi:nucleoid DNA-binding protein